MIDDDHGLGGPVQDRQVRGETRRLFSFSRLFVWVCLAAVGVAGCGGPSVTLDQDPEAFEEKENRLQDRLSDHPDDGEALRELGSIYLRTDRPSQAYDALKKSFSQRPEDPKVLFYLGLASEQVGRREAALKLFSRFDEVPEDSRYHTLMEGRYEWLSRQQARRQAREMVAQEQKQPADLEAEMSSDVVAVVPMEYQGGDDQYAPLGRGLAEMFTTDLANVGRLKVVERVRLQAILDELELARSQYVDQSTAPRVGRLLGAGRLVGGSYLVTDDEQVRLQVTLANVGTGERMPQLENQRASLSDLFDLQTKVTFSIVDQLGVELTPQERAAIQEVPTQSIQAFLAYSRGLMEEDRGNFGTAAQYYRQAQQMDPNFEQAAQRSQKAEGMETAGGSQAKALSNAEQGGQQQQQSEGINVMNQTLQSLGAAPGGMGGEQNRDPSQEEGTADDAAPLPDAPDPPSGNGGNGGS
jgi:TolB-like protein